MSYTIHIAGHSIDQKPEEIEEQARELVHGLDGVASATLSDGRGMTDLLASDDEGTPTSSSAPSDVVGDQPTGDA